MIEQLLVFVFGLCIGSFLNVCIFRLPKNKSIVKPASSCPKCRKLIRRFDNIPLLSYYILGGKCRNCRKKISIRYPIVELITGMIFLVLYRQLGLSLSGLQFALFFSLLIVVSFIDIDYHAIPAYLCPIGIGIGLVFALIKTFELMGTGLYSLEAMPILVAFRAMIFGFGFSYLFKFFGDVFISFYLKLRKKESIEGEKESMGLGDVDFMGMVGVFMGVKAVLLVFFMAPFLAVIYSVFALIFKRSHLIPYLPYLSLAAVITFFYGNQILRLIFG